MLKKETKNCGIRFPVWLIAEIEKIAEIEDRDFSKEIIHLCKTGVQRYYLEKRAEKKAATELEKRRVAEKINKELKVNPSNKERKTNSG